jgi:cyclopropane fatty-acyl-phospholipid synthase-like methyltransferase
MTWESLWSTIKVTSLPFKIHHKAVFRGYKALLDPLNLNSPNILEIGCGSGELTARIIERYGGEAVLLDNCDEAISQAMNNLERHNLKEEFINGNIFDHKTQKLLKKFDIVHSEGLIEHFTKEEQKKLIYYHQKFLKDNGYLLITVPKPAWYYKIWKTLWESGGKWQFGYEKAMNSEELKKLLEKCGLRVIRYFDFFRYSFALCTKL